MTNIKNHFLICGWKPGFEKILEGVLTANPEIPPEKIVIVNNAKLSKMEAVKANEKLKNLNFIRGNFTDEDTLLKRTLAQPLFMHLQNATHLSWMEKSLRSFATASRF